MRLVSPGKAVVGIVSVALLAFVAWAWIDGGREPLHAISQPVPVPESAR